MQAERAGAAIAQGVLQAIFVVFLGLMITAVVGVGVYTFLPNPAEATEQRIADLNERRDHVQGCSKVIGCDPIDQLTVAERAELAALDVDVKALEEQASEQRQEWTQRSSIVLILIAMGLMVVSLVLGDSLSVLSNGILLGGLFTMLYGVGWGIASGSSLTRFLVLVAALVVSLLLGYLKFARSRDGGEPRPADAPTPATPTPATPTPATPTAGGPPGELPADVGAALGVLAVRLSELERRVTAAGAWLGNAPEQPADRSSPPG